MKKDNKDIQLLKEELWSRRMTAEIAILGRKIIANENNIIKEIRRNNTRKKEVIQALKKKDRLTQEEDGVVYMEGKVYILNNKKIRKEILKKNHDSVDVGHLEQQRMLELLKRNYWWPGLKKDIRKYIQGYFKC